MSPFTFEITTELAADAQTVLDRLTFAPRVRWSGSFLKLIVEALFSHRHRRLRARFGAIDTSNSPSIARA